MRGVRGEPVEFRFGRNYEWTSDGCWTWTGAINERGYDTFNPSPGVKVYAHRWCYQYVVGPVPEDLELDHLCRNTRCVNPAHLEAVTAEENQRRRDAAVTACIHGHAFTEANTYRPPGQPTRRQCRQCSRERVRLRHQTLVATATSDS